MKMCWILLLLWGIPAVAEDPDILPDKTVTKTNIEDDLTWDDLLGEQYLTAVPEPPKKSEDPTPTTLSLSLPTTPLIVGQQFVITVQGVPAVSLPDMQILAAPSTGLTWISGTGLKAGSPAFIACTATQAGQYTFLVAARDNASGMLSASQIIQVASSVTPIPGPTPPPGPGPNPPPGPTPVPVPVEVKARVLVMYPESGRTQDQSDLIFNMSPGRFRNYLDLHCVSETVKTAEGTTLQISGFRVWPVSLIPATTSGFQKLWEAANAVKDDKGAVKPCMVVEINGVPTRYEFPASSDDAKATLATLGVK